MAKQKKNDKELRMYCGVKDVPKGMVRASPEYCVQHNQIRYYGLVAIKPKLLKTAKGTTSDLNKEKLKMLKLRDLMRIKINEMKTLKITIDDDNAKPAKIRQAEKKYATALKRGQNLVKQFEAQKKIVMAMEEEEKEAKKRLKKKPKKKGSKSKKKRNK